MKLKTTLLGKTYLFRDIKDVLAKAREGIKWCHYASIADTDKKPWQYHLITDDIISVGNTFKYTIGMSKVITEE